jgi:hypothetical protein
MMKDMNYYNSFGYRLSIPFKRMWFKFLLKRGRLIKVDERHRGIGKTYMMIEMAIKHDIPIIAGSQQQMDAIKRNGNPCDVYGFAKGFTKNVLGKEFPNGILIDESVDPELIPELEARFTIRGGFIQNYGKK